MEKKYTTRLSLFLMMVFFSTALVAQDIQTKTEKKIVITIRGKDAQGVSVKWW
jgi:hypothetical protein